MNPSRILFPLLSLLLGACAVGPDYRRPELATPTQWQAPLPHAGKLDALSDWWAQFNDPALDALLRAAQADSPTLDKASAAIRSARANLRSAGASLQPSLSAAITQTQAGSKQGNGAMPVNTTASALDASWEIDLFGGTRRGIESARALNDAREADWHDARISLAAEVATNYVDYRACQLQLAAYQDALRSQRATAELTALAVKAGFSAAADGALAEASLASASASATAQAASCDVTRKALVALSGLDETRVGALLDSQPVRIPQPAARQIDSVPAQLLTQRPDLVSAERSLASASAQIGVADAARYPSLTLNGSISLSASNAASSVPWSFGPTLAIPLLNGGALSAKLESARAAYDSALASYKSAVRTAVKEVEQALVRLDGARRREDDARTSAAGYRAYFIASEANWRAGGTSLLNLETARRNAITAELNLISLEQTRVENWIALYKALGGGWNAEASSAASSTVSTPRN
ncbi:efflux transporter outer membrane subunit [Uliginosibacterium sediminicola]|uniref:Efflux transporter outer membrane subunit n=1 Tax=Uliginosibacterium sediminicola TaxID=2024550 RepID=A0ABU9Z019_9RHOO